MRRLPFLISLGFSVTSALIAAGSESSPFLATAISERGIHSEPCRIAQPSVEKDTAIAVIQSAEWSPNDAARDGAREFEVLLQAAALARRQPLVGMIGVGNRAGLLRPESERALTRVALMGIPVVKVASRGQVDVDEDNLFVEAGDLDAATAERVLAECLTRFGALPSVRDPFAPEVKEIDQLRSHLARFQGAFNAARESSVVAMR